MSFGDALGDADEILTLIALIPAIFLVASMIPNLSNPNLDTTAYMTELVNTLVQGLVPNIGLIILLALFLFAYRNID